VVVVNLMRRDARLLLALGLCLGFFFALGLEK
jgi:hypothetical protein